MAFVALPGARGSPNRILTFGRNQSVRVWDADAGTSGRSWKGHRLPVACCDADRSGTLVASSGADKLLCVWDVDHGHATHSLRGHEATVSVVRFMPHPHAVERLASGDDTGKIRIWDLHGSACVAMLGEHYTTVTALLFSPEPSGHGHTMVSTGRDKVLAVWDTREFTIAAAGGAGAGRGGRGAGSAAPVELAARSTVTVLEGIEGAVTLPIEAAHAAAASAGSGFAAGSSSGYTLSADGIADAASRGKEMVFLTAGDRGRLRKWRLTVSGDGRDRSYETVCLQNTDVHALRQGLPASAGSAAASSGAAAAGSSSAGAAAAAAPDAELPVSRQFGGLLLRPRRIATAAAAAAAGSTGSDAADSTGLIGSKRRRPLDAAASGSAAAAGSAAAGSAAAGRGGSSAGGAGSGGFELLAVTRDHVLTLVDAASLGERRTIVGYNDDILDLKYLPSAVPAGTPAAGAADGVAAVAASSAAAAAGGAATGFVPRLAMATNSEQLRLLDLRSFNARLLDGHAGIILGVSPSPDGTLVATASKDATARVWDVATGHCLAVCEGHTEAVTTIAFPSRAANFMRQTLAAGDRGAAAAGAGSAAASGSGSTAVTGANGWLLTASKDRTLKLWQLASLLSTLRSPRPEDWASRSAAVFSAPPARPRTSAAVVAHDKDVNAVAVAPNDRLAATGSADKTVKLWSLPDLTLVATLRGHRRGVWALAFSPADQVLATASGDRTIRLWAVTASAGYACLRTFEGHDASALNVRFLRRGTQLVSSGADGLVKLWTVRTGECVNTFDAHTQKIWALAVRPADLAPEEVADAGAGASAGAGADSAEGAGEGGEGGVAEVFEAEMVSGGGDSVLNVWRDVTADEAEAGVAATEAALAKQQRLLSAMAARDYHAALALTLDLDQPRRAGDILTELLEVGPLPVTATMSPAQREALHREAALDELAELQSLGDASGAAAASSAAAALSALGLHDDIASASAGGAASSGGEYRSRSAAKAAAGAAKAVQVLRHLRPLHLGRLLLYMREWNTQSRNGALAQRLLHLLLRHLPQRALLAACAAILSVASGHAGGGGALTVLPGIGSVLAPGAAGALSLAAAGALAPVVDPGDADGEATAAMLAASGGGAGAAASAAAAARSNAAAVDLLRSLVAALLPYGERHLERLDRLLVASHAADHTLAGMAVLAPSAEELAALGLDADGKLRTGASSRGRVVRSEFASDDEDDDASDDDDGTF